MTIFHEDGFETGDVSAWPKTKVTPNESLVVDSDVPFKGEFALRSKGLGGPDQYSMVLFPAGKPLVHARCMSRINGGLPLPKDGNRINFIIFWGCGNIAVGRANGVDQFQLRTYVKGKPWKVINTGIIPEIGRQYCLEYAVQAGQWAKFWIDGQLVGEEPLAGVNTSNAGDVGFGLGITVASGHTGLDVSTDECVVADSYIGPPVSDLTINLTTEPEKNVPILVDGQVVTTPDTFEVSPGTYTLEAPEEVGVT